MKLINIIKLLSVLLCIFALFAACDSAEETTTAPETTEQTTTETETEEATRGEVEPVLDNFFTFSELDSWIELGEAKRLEGTCVSKTYNNEIIVLRNAEVSDMNVVTETFTVYNTVLEKTVLTFQNTYDYDKYSAFDWDNIYVNDETVKYPASVMKVEVINVSSTFIVKVSKATVTPTSEEVLEKNEGANYYTITVNCEFFDVAGTKVVDTKIDTDPYIRSVNDSVVCISIGDTLAYFDAETDELIKTIKADNQTTIAAYDDETEKYGYFFGTHKVALGHSVEYVQVYDKAKATCILTHYFDPAYDVTMSVLENGKVFVQVHNLVEDDVDLPYDYEINGKKFTLDSYLLDVKKDTLTAIECDFIVDAIDHVTADSAEAYAEMGIKLTDNVDNVALVRYIKDTKVDYCQVAVIDNRFQVLFVLDRIVPEHNVTLQNGFGFEIIADGNYLVYLHNVVTSRAIVAKDGTVRCYLNDGDHIVDKYVVNQYGIFDFNMNLLFDFAENDLTFSTVTGNKIIVSKLVEIYEEIEEETENNNDLFFPDDEPEETETETGTETETEYADSEEETQIPDAEPTPIEVYLEYYVITVDDGNNFSYDSIYSYSDRMELITDESTNEYVIFKSLKTGKCFLYNIDLEHVLTTHASMNVYRCDDKYIVSTKLPVNGVVTDVFYTIGIVIEE